MDMDQWDNHDHCGCAVASVETRTFVEPCSGHVFVMYTFPDSMVSVLCTRLPHIGHRLFIHMAPDSLSMFLG